MQKCLLDRFDFVFSVEFNFLAKFSPFTSKPRPIILCISLDVIGRSAILLSSSDSTDEAEQLINIRLNIVSSDNYVFILP